MEKYQIIRPVSEGQHGKVFLALDKQNNQNVTIQTVLPRSQEQYKYWVEHYKQECYYLSQIQHPNVIKAYDLFQKGEYIFFVTEHIEGIALSEFISSQVKQFTFCEQVEMAIQMASAVAAVNEFGIVHQNINPSNLVVRNSDKRIKLIELGRQNPLDRRTGQMSGIDWANVEYLSPEQLEGNSSTNSDVFSLGVILYQFFTQGLNSPFKTNNPETTIANIHTQTLPLLTKQVVIPNIEPLANVVENCLEKSPRQRLESAQKLKDELKKVYRMAATSAGARISNTVKKKVTVPIKKNNLELVRTKAHSSRRVKPKTFSTQKLAMLLLVAIILLGSYIYYYNRQKIRRVANENFEASMSLYKDKKYQEAWQKNTNALQLSSFSYAQLHHARMLFHGHGVKRNTEQAGKIAKSVLTSGNVPKNAMKICLIAEMYEHGIGVSKDNFKAVTLYEKAAKKEFPLAMFRLGMIYLEKKEYTKALAWFKKAADLQNGDAMGEIGKLHILKRIPNSNIDEAVVWLERGVESGSAIAMNSLAYVLHNGLDGNRDIIKAVNLLKQAAEKEDPVACLNIGKVYIIGKDIEQNIDLGISYVKKAAAYNTTKAMHYLGEMYEEGKVVLANYEQAFSWYQQAAQEKHLDSIYKLGTFYEKGMVKTQDIDQAINFYEQAASQNHIPSILQLGKVFIDTLGKKQQGFQWYQKGANLGDLIAIHNLATLHKRGIGTPVSISSAAVWYKKAALKGFVESMYELGVLYSDGQGIPLDSRKAIMWLTKAGNAKHSSALNHLGTIYFKSIGIPQDITRAIDFFKKSADLGNEIAMENLGFVYENLKKPNKKLALAWYKKAVERGNAKARKSYMRLLQETRNKE